MRLFAGRVRDESQLPTGSFKAQGMKTAIASLDRYEKPMQLASMLGTASTDKWSGLLELVRKPTDPRYNSFDWETWHECDVFRAEVERKLAGK